MKIKQYLLSFFICITLIITLQIVSFAESIYFEKNELNLLSDLNNNDISKKVDTNSVYYEKQWNYDIINGEKSWELIDKPNDLIIAVIDSGLYYEHPDLDKTKIYEGVNYVGNVVTKDVSDSMGHGTKTVGIITRLNPYAKILPIHVVNSKGKTDIYSTINAIKGIIQFNKNPKNKVKIKVINLSLGSLTYSQSYENVIKEAIDSGIIVVAAVGNYGKSEDTKYDIRYPSGYKDVIGVASIDKNKQRSLFSQVNSTVFITAPGEDILSLNYLDNIKKYNELYNENISGTSIATPHVAALAGLVAMIDININQKEFKGILMNTSTDLGEKGYDIEYGYGLINVEKAIKYVINSEESIQEVSNDSKYNSSSWIENVVVFIISYVEKLLINK